MTDMRVIVTGSRRWPSEDAVWERLAWLIAENLDAGDTLTVVHGDCQTGADSFVRSWFQLPDSSDGVTLIEERHPADWDRYGMSAGPRRNAEMIRAGADLVLAFPYGESRGTRHCTTAARKAGIPVEFIDPPTQLRMPMGTAVEYVRDRRRRAN